VAFKSPLPSLAEHSSGRAIGLVVLEKAIEHIRVAEFAKRLTARAEFDIVVGRRGGGTQKPVGHFSQEFRYDRPTLSVEGFNRARLIANSPSEIVPIEVMQSLIVRDGDT
jgi:hypothetical protein